MSGIEKTFLADAYLKAPQEVLSHLKVKEDVGLTDEEITERRKKFGSNELPAPEPTPFWKLVLKQFDDLLVKILLGAAVVSLGLAFLEENDEHGTAFIEPLVIGAILVANATVGVLQEKNAEEAIEALKEFTAEKAIRIQNGKEVEVDAKDLVLGDIVSLKVGALIPADIRLISYTGSTFSVDEAPLTGESEAVNKEVTPISEKTTLNQRKKNIVFSGTLISRGNGVGVVVQIGDDTEIGKIQKKIMEDDDEEETPLQKKLDEFGETLSKVISVICVLVWLVNINHFNDPEHGSMVKGAIYYFKIAVALAVAAIPEGLPAVVTTCLALGTRKMAQKNAIVRNLPSVESLGCTTVICSDKTGTLTTNMMTVKQVFTLSKDGKSIEEYAVEGESFNPAGSIKQGTAVVSKPASLASLSKIAEISTLCNNSSVAYTTENGKSTFTKTGEATEAALLVLSEKIGHEGEAKPTEPAKLADFTKSFWKSKYDTVVKLDFDRKRKSMGVIVKNKATSKHSIFVKGAPESVLERSTLVLSSDTNTAVPLTPEIRKVIMDKFTEYGGKTALRCLALAYADNFSDVEAVKTADSEDYINYEKNLTFVGIAGIIDPPRPDVRQSIAKCKEAGIRVIVITGDNKITAEAICRQIGVFDSENITGLSFDGDQFEKMTPEEKAKAVRKANLFARTNPSHKSDIVALLKKDNQVVAMTGDGVNDAPALKAADIGVAMGSGTGVARKASKIVLADDNFSTIVYAVEEGRAIYNNMKQFIRYLISSNIGEVVCIFLTAVTGTPEALIPVQLLWVNLVTDGLPATALGFNPAEKDIMKRKPRSNDDPIVNGWLFFRYVVIGVYVGVATVAGFVWWNMSYENGPLMSWAQLSSHATCSADWKFANGFDCTVFKDFRPSSMSLSILVTIEMFNAMNSVSENQSILSMTPFVNGWLIIAICTSFALHFLLLYTPGLAALFSVAPLNMEEWKAVVLISLPVILVDEMLKFLSRSGLGSSSAKPKQD